jgi:hypothetical protein
VPFGGPFSGGPHGADDPQVPVPERTASGLVRRVRGAQTAGTAADDTGSTPLVPGAPPGATTRAASIDGAEMQRFLTSLAGGVQRSLDEQGSSPGGGGEG